MFNLKQIKSIISLQNIFVAIFLLLLLLVGLTTLQNNQLQKTNLKLKEKIELNTKDLDSLYGVIKIRELQLFEEKAYSTSLEKDLVKLKTQYDKIYLKHENLKKHYSTLSNDDKWKYFRTIITK